jgi:hypothetical protein
MTNKEGEKKRPQRDKKERKNCSGHCLNVLLSHLGSDGHIGLCGPTRIVDFKILGYCSKKNLFQNP